ncbi:MAG TPA: PAS domain-containing protein [Stellaceae bacterium]|nr:PAS domain-containing protein [Stellaceae bacterium]
MGIRQSRGRSSGAIVAPLTIFIVLSVAELAAWWTNVNARIPAGPTGEISLTKGIAIAAMPVAGLLLAAVVALLLHRARTAKARLEQSERRLNDFTAVAGDWFWETGPDLRFTFMSRRPGDDGSTVARSLLGLTPLDLIARDDESDASERHQKDLEARRPFNDFIYRRKSLPDEPERWFRSSGQPFYDRAGRFLGFRGVASDITDALQTGREAQLAQTRLRDTVELIPEGVAIYDAEDRLILCNGRYRQMYSVLADLLVPGARFADLVRAAADRGAYGVAPDRVEELVAERIRHHSSGRGHSEHRLKDGRWIQVTERRTNDGGIVGVWTDVTEIRGREEALRRSEERFLGMTANLPGLVFQARYDIEKGLSFEFVSDGVRELFGVEPRAARTSIALLRRRLHSDDAERVITSALDAAARHQRWSCEYRVVDKAGGLKWLRTVASPRQTIDGLLWDGIVQDITDRKRYEEALRESEERYALAMRGASEGLWQLDLRTNEVYLAPQFAALFGLGDCPGTEISERFQGRVHPDDRARRADAFRRHVQGLTAIYSCEYRILDAGGNYIWMLDRGVALRDDLGRAYRMAGSVADISARKAHEEQLRAAKEQAEIANRTKTEFLANVSHELRTPLNAIIGFSHVIRDELLGVVGQPKYREYANDINVSGQHLLAVINDILDVAKIEAGKSEIDEAVLDVAQAAEAATRLVRQRAEEAGLKLECHLPEDLPRLRADNRKLKQILINLLSNGVKFTPAGGFVRLTAEILVTGEMSIRVADTGIGIAAGDIAKALAPFGQVDSALSRRYEGTGLGLSLVQSLVKLHGGRFDLASEVDRGTTASVIFPSERVLRARQVAIG